MDTNAVSIGEKWLPYRESGTEHIFTVHSVFGRAINISNNCQLLSIVANGMGGSSAFLTLPGRDLALGATVGEICTLHAGRVITLKNTINFCDSPVWKRPISNGYRQEKVKKDNITAFKAVLDRKAAPQSAWRNINSGAGSRFKGLSVIKQLKENPSLARNLIGLGIGLTPAGDDLLVGFLAMVNHTCEDRDYINLLHGSVAAHLNNTVDFSAKMLANALDCDYHGSVQKCIRDLCEGESEDIYISAASLINMGATSGSDIACGMYYGMLDPEIQQYEPIIKGELCNRKPC